MGLSFSSIAGAALKLGVALGVGLGFKDMITNTMNAQKTMAQMDAVLKSTGGAAGMTKDQLIALADSQGKLTTYSKGANEQTENLLLTFTSIGQKVFPDALKTVNDMSTALGQDTKSSAIQLGKALQDPIKGVTALSRVGVNFTAQQKEQIKTLVKTGDTLGAQKIILAELHKEFGGSAEAAGKTFAGALTILQNQFKGVGVSIGTMLIPYMTNFIKTITDNMPKIKDTINAAISFIIPLFQKWMTLIGQIASELFPSMGSATDSVKGKVSSFSGALNIVTGILTFVKDHLGLVKGALDILAIAWVINKAHVIATNVVLAANNVVTTAKNVISAIESARIYAVIIAQDLYSIAVGKGSIATKAITIAQYLFNTALSLNPIGLVIIGLVALGAAIYVVVTHFQEICTWVQNAWNWLNQWNSTPAQNKSATVTTTNTSSGTGLVGRASGDSNWQGGLGRFNEVGGEIMDLPKGTRIIPHDVSMEMAKNNNKETKKVQPAVIQLVLSNGKALAEFMIDDINYMLDKKTAIQMRRS